MTDPSVMEATAKNTIHLTFHATLSSLKLQPILHSSYHLKSKLTTKEPTSFTADKTSHFPMVLMLGLLSIDMTETLGGHLFYTRAILAWLRIKSQMNKVSELKLFLKGFSHQILRYI